MNLIDVRRKNTFDRLKYRAEREGKSVVLLMEFCPVDGNAVFSLSAGHIIVMASDCLISSIMSYNCRGL
jgi:uncharacterized membrane protein YdjX (TVP38/TMEM64 family)